MTCDAFYSSKVLSNEALLFFLLRALIQVRHFNSCNVIEKSQSKCFQSTVSWAVPKNQGIYACRSSSVPKKIICVVEIIYFVEIVANTRRLLFKKNTFSYIVIYKRK